MCKNGDTVEINPLDKVALSFLGVLRGVHMVKVEDTVYLTDPFSYSDSKKERVLLYQSGSERGMLTKDEAKVILINYFRAYANKRLKNRSEEDRRAILAFLESSWKNIGTNGPKYPHYSHYLGTVWRR